MSYMMRGREAELAGDLAGARDAYRRAIDTGEGGSAAKLLLLEVLDALHDDEAVLALCDDLDGKGRLPDGGRRVVVKSAAIAIARANAHLRGERWEHAVESAKAALAEIAEAGGVVAGPGQHLAPFDAWFVLGQALKFGGDPAASIEPYRRAIELVPESSRAHFELAQSLAATGNLTDAEGLAQRATELDPDDNDAFYNLACYRSLLGQRVGAIAALSRAIALEANNAKLARTDADFADLRGDAEFDRLTR